MTVIAVLLASEFFGLVGLHYPRAVENNPLKSPVLVKESNGTRLVLADGRTLELATFSVWSRQQGLETGDLVDVEQYGGDQVAVYTSERGWICGTPWARMVNIPLIPDDVPINRRELYAIASVSDSKQ